VEKHACMHAYLKFTIGKTMVGEELLNIACAVYCEALMPLSVFC
jgi:hypothetical protein